MHLEKLSGIISFGDIKITPNTILTDIATLPGNYEVKLVVNNGDYKTLNVRHVDDGEFAMNVSFYKGNITFLSIGLSGKYGFPPFVITQNEIDEVNMKLSTIGGPNTYKWGKVELWIDNKGGSVSMGITYRRPITGALT